MCVAASGDKLFEFGKAFCDFGDPGSYESGPRALWLQLIGLVHLAPFPSQFR